MPTGSTLRRVDGAAGVLSRWPWLSGRWQTPGDRLGCTPLHVTGPAPCRASSIWLCLVWAWAALCVGCMACACACLQAGCLRPCAGKRRGGGFFRAELPSGARRQAPRDRGGGLLSGKQPGNGELTAPGGQFHGKRQGHPIQINHLEPSYFFVTCRGMLGGNLWAKCGIVRRAFRDGAATPVR